MSLGWNGRRTIYIKRWTEIDKQQENYMFESEQWGKKEGGEMNVDLKMKM